MREKEYNKLAVNIIQFIFGLILLSMILFSFVGCSAYKQIPINDIEKIVYKDTTIYVNDTVNVAVPFEVVREVLPKMDTSYLQTSVASSIAYLDTAKRQIHHTLQQKGVVQAKLDTVVTVQYIDRFIQKEVPVEVEVIKYKRDVIYWLSIMLNIIAIMIFGFKIYIKMIK